MGYTLTAKQEQAKMDSPSQAPKGRPTIFVRDIADIIIERLASGESLRKICSDEGMPAESTVRLWATSDRDGFHARYTRAREFQMDALSEDLLEIADNAKADVQRSRLQVDTRKWLMSKIAPKRFGDRVAMEHTGRDGGPIEYANLSEEEIDARIATLIAGAGPSPLGEEEGISSSPGSEDQEGNGKGTA